MDGIRCGHCGGRHPDVATVRACSVRVASPGPATPGMYRRRGQIFRVDMTPGGLVANLATIGQDARGQARVSYRRVHPEVLATLSQADRMDAEEVAAFGQLTTVCLRCGRLLEHPDSVARGLGDYCARQVGILV